jgi:hypothetical protein
MSLGINFSDMSEQENLYKKIACSILDVFDVYV